MKKTFLILALLAATSTAALATRVHANTGPDIKTPPSNPTASKRPPEPKAPARAGRDDGQRDTGTLCSRWPSMVFCPQP